MNKKIIISVIAVAAAVALVCAAAAVLFATGVFNPPQVNKRITLDFNDDGKKETVEIRTLGRDADENYSLTAFGDAGEKLVLELNRFHVGWDSISLCRSGDGYCLLEYNPYANQGLADYYYNLYGYSEEKGFYLKESDAVRFDKNGKEPLPVDEMLRFADKINNYLKDSELLISTLNGELTTGGKLPDERYSWVEEFVTDGDLSLGQKLNAYSEEFVKQYHNGEE